MRLEINLEERENWISAYVEDGEGNRLGEDHAPFVEGATFDARAAVTRSAIEKALVALADEVNDVS